ncbi:MAG: guanylate kinase [Planctomycetes bacterium]|nr:guanylate kinase [Planctomycetota bacterium]
MTDAVEQSGKTGFRGGLVVISGPSGSGKTTIVDLLAKDPRVEVAVTATTRPLRPGEVDGVDYFFLSREEFLARVARGDFVEYNEVFRNGHLYGSLKAPLLQALARRDRYYVLEIDIEGGITLIDRGFAGIYLFIAPPSLEELRRRIERRGTESAEAIAARIRKTELELALKEKYDRVVVNDVLERAHREVRALLGLDEPAAIARQ